MSAEIKIGAKLESAVAQQLFQTSIRFKDDCPYAVSPDGARSLVNTLRAASNPAPMTIVLNWTSDLKR